MAKIKLDPRNYRKHSDRNKGLIAKSLKELGAGRSIVTDAAGVIIGGNGVFEQAEKQKIKTKIVETDGTELIIVKRTDIAPGSEKRRQLALADNAVGETSEFDFELLGEDFEDADLLEWGVISETIEELIPNLTEEKSISQHADEYSGRAIKQIVTYFLSPDYEEVLDLLEKITHTYGLKNHSEALLLVLRKHQNE